MLTDISRREGDAGLATKFSRFLARTFLASSAYKHMHHFADTFSKLVAIGAEDSGEGRLLQALGAVAVDAEVFPDLSVADVVVRTAFRSSPIYKSFMTARVD